MGKELFKNIPSKVGDLVKDVRNGRIGLFRPSRLCQTPRSLSWQNDFRNIDWFGILKDAI